MLAPAACLALTANAVPRPPCPITVPAEIRGGQARWLGDCVAGRAAGPGVLRVAAGRGFAFFFGRATSGRPVTGLVMHPSGNYTQIRGLDRAGRTLLADGDHIAEQDRAWADAAAGARRVAHRFARAGNTASSAFYLGWARKFESRRPE